jgi:D-alanyl-lipoteichoic acid acyltransferase DltB (MBOAT superfamily)
MLFPTTDFAIFFALVFLANWLLNPFRTRWKVFMVLASYVFYAWWDWRLVWLLALVTLIAQAGALWVARREGERARRLAVMVSVAATLAPLLWFKYYGFLSLNLENLFGAVGASSPLPLIQVLLPVGISFYTFMALSYVVDVYREQLEPAGWLDFFVYLSFFPHLVAGPIVRGGELLPQFRGARDPRRLDVARATYLILGGLFKKVVVSSYLAAAIVDPVFGDPARFGAIDVLFAIYAYAIVIYADFSGYTDIAIGVAELLGFRFPPNFNRPYAARSVQDFWRRWHMTLSRWLRDYLYIPLGGSRKGERRTYVNVMLTMVLGGLWHGAGWTFLAWGALHGLGLAFDHWRTGRRAAARLEPLASDPASVLRQRVATFHLVCLGWVFFRAESFGAGFGVLGRLVTGWGLAPALVTPVLVLVIGGSLLMQYLPHHPAQHLQVAFSRLRPWAQGVGAALALVAITTLGPQGVAPFIYFQF